MITLYTGRPGTGKSLFMADKMTKILKRNQKYLKKTGKVRAIYSNMKLNPNLEKKFETFINYWENPEQLIWIRDADVFWDEIATHLDASQYKDTPLDLKRWLQQHRKFGVEIYGTTQDFAMIDIAMRRMTQKVFLLRKIFGSRDPSPTRPPVKNIWGFIFKWFVDPIDYKEEQKNSQITGLPSIFRITEKRVNFFDTRQEIKMGKYPPLRHIVRRCIDPECDFLKTVHQ